MNEFFELLFGIVRKWSEDRAPSGAKKFYKNVSLETAMESCAYYWATSQDKNDRCHSNNSVDYYFCYDSPLTAAKLSNFQQIVEKRKTKSFDDYVLAFNEIGRVTINDYYNPDWRKSICTCWNWQKKGVCKHVLGVFMRNNFHSPSGDCIKLSNGEKKKRGPKPKAIARQCLIKN